MCHRMSRLISLGCILFLLSGYARGQDAPLASVPGARYLFGLSAAPAGKTILLFSSGQVPEGEVSFGTVTLLRLDSPNFAVKRLSVPESHDDLTLPVWTSAGDIAYLLTTKGLYALSMNTMLPKLLLRGTLAGLALSPDNTKLAFWDLAPEEEFHYGLQIFDLKVRKTIRKWSLATLYSSDR